MRLEQKILINIIISILQFDLIQNNQNIFKEASAL